MAILTKGLPSSALKGEAGGIKERQRHLGEQVPTSMEEPLLHNLLLFPKPPHPTVQVVQLKILAPWDPNIPLPTIRCPVRARLKQAMEHRQVHSSFHRELEPPSHQQLTEHFSYLLPQPAEGQVGPNSPDLPRFKIAAAIPVHHTYLLGMPPQGTDKGIGRSTGGQLVQAAQRAHNSLDSAASFPAVLHHLEVAVVACLLDPDKHTVPPIVTPHIYTSAKPYVK